MGQTHNIDIADFAFPETTIARGDTVAWTNRMGMTHTVTADNGEFDSGNLLPGQSFSHTFDFVGTISYHCERHPDMQGSVIIQ